MRVTLVAVLVGGAFVAGWYVRGMKDARDGVSAPVVPARTAQKAQDCRDDCEQHAIVEKLGDDWVRDCRNRCGPVGNPGTTGPANAGRPYEPIKRITRAPADHSQH